MRSQYIARDLPDAPWLTTPGADGTLCAPHRRASAVDGLPGSCRMAQLQSSTPDSFLPDLCGVRALFAVVIIGELLAFVLTLAGAGVGREAFADLALISLYSQGIGLSAAGALCLARHPLSRLPEAAEAALSYLLVLCVVVVVCEVAWRVVNPVAGAGAIVAIGHRDLLLRTLGISAIVAALVLRYFYVQHHWQQRTASEADARLQALQARIRPHFFFNCMNTIASLTRSNPARAERAVEDLAELFRASLSDARALVPLAQEIELARRYLGIETLRLGDRLRVSWNIDELPAAARLPLLTLQPLIENAIYHGIEPVAAGGEIRIDGRAQRDRLELSITNPCAPPAGSGRAGNRIAQDNVRQRLYAHFGDTGRLLIETSAAVYRVTIAWPITPDDAARHRR